MKFKVNKFPLVLDYKVHGTLQQWLHWGVKLVQWLTPVLVSHRGLLWTYSFVPCTKLNQSDAAAQAVVILLVESCLLLAREKLISLRWKEEPSSPDSSASASCISKSLTTACSYHPPFCLASLGVVTITIPLFFLYFQSSLYLFVHYKLVFIALKPNLAKCCCIAVIENTRRGPERWQILIAKTSVTSC